MNESITAGTSELSDVALVCDCHSTPMRWHRDPRREAGGYWRCRIQRRGSDRRYDATKNRRESRRRYRESEKGQATLLRYLQSATYRRCRMRAAQRRWQEQIQRYEAQLGAGGKDISYLFVAVMSPVMSR